MSWCVHPARIRETWVRPGRRLVVYWDVCDEWAMAWAEESDRAGEPEAWSRFRLLAGGFRREALP
jgi:hypothetical protein